ncbi:allophanate hydrolase [Rhodococcus sp. SC4]|uniref:5-oxoprolinase subunit C family protein n=1 Tax=Rhodococcus sp. LB1 TaxID=1807499 RepID=UPI00076A74FF|nr:biotin-dependent carboxyltransferase family protein [Rhodococcus sp. LB1]KXF49488.1 allophanate hydrolase [Rhodococcus sp. SC4]KXX61061.1 allophanate hydrolase [Rhodococcus sp. LB1]
MSELEVLETGPLSLIQDLGRPGYLSSGVGVSGAADRGSAKLANRLVGNDENSACIEVLMGGLALRAPQVTIVAVTGAPATALLDGIPMGHASVIVMQPGQTLRLQYAQVGLRSYVGVRGGVAVPNVLGSRSTDTLSGIGPEALKPDDVLPVGSAATNFPNVDVAPVPPMDAGTLSVRVIGGPRDDWFTNPEALTTGVWAVSPDTDRIGTRLNRHGDSPALVRTSEAELPTEGVALGSIQVPPSGQPVVFLADHPISGGYPVIGVVADEDIDRIAQARPGQLIRFTTA